MTDQEFYMKQVLGGIKDSIDDVKGTMSTQHASFNVKLDMIIANASITDKKADKAHDRLDMQVQALTDVKIIAEKALFLGEDYNDNKKKAIFAGGLLVSMGAFFAWLAGFIVK